MILYTVENNVYFICLNAAVEPIFPKNAIAKSQFNNWKINRSCFLNFSRFIYYKGILEHEDKIKQK